MTRPIDNLATLPPPGDALNAYNATALGTFMVQQDFDNKYAFSNIDFMRFMLGLNAHQYLRY